METKSREVLLKEFLRMEIARKGQATTLAFIMFSIFVFIRPFGTIQFKTLIQGIILFVFVSLIWRYIHLAKIRKKNFMTDRDWLITRFIILLNSLCWSTVLALGAFEHELVGFHFVVITTLVSGIVGASIVTLSYSNGLFIPFQLLMLGPQAALILYFSFTKNMDYLPLISLYILYFVYQVKQSQSYRQELIKVFNYQFDLEKSNNELKNSQSALMAQTAKLLHTSRLAALGEISASIAHEVNNPLMVINGSVTQLKRLIIHKSSQQQNFSSDGADFVQIDNLLEKIRKSSDRVTHIFGGLKYFGAQSDVAPKETIQLNTILLETQAFTTELLKANFIQFQIGHVPTVSLYCHPIQISQVLINLIKNAVDALTDFQKKTNTIGEHWVKLSFTEKDNFIEIFISNSGEKIPLELAKRLFQPFFTTKASGKGTGLGLSISMTIIEEHKGTLTFEPAYNDTTFKIKLPIANSCE